MTTLRIVEYVDRRGRSPFGRWLAGLGPHAAAKVTAAVYRLEQGNLSNVKGVGAGVLERVIDSGPGFRIYFGRDGDTLVVLLGGSTKRDQKSAIEAAAAHWKDYRARKDES